MKDHLADDVSLKVSRLFSEIDLTNNFLSQFCSGFSEKGTSSCLWLYFSKAIKEVPVPCSPPCLVFILGAFLLVLRFLFVLSFCLGDTIFISQIISEHSSNCVLFSFHSSIIFAHFEMKVLCSII